MNDIFWMARALLIANKALAIKEFPVGAVLVYDNFELSCCFNSCYIYNICHAENNIFNKSFFYFARKSLSKSTLYITLEPCAICFSFIAYYRIKKLVFAAHSNNYNSYNIEVKKGILEKESLILIEKFFNN